MVEATLSPILFGNVAWSTLMSHMVLVLIVVIEWFHDQVLVYFLILPLRSHSRVAQDIRCTTFIEDWELVDVHALIPKVLLYFPPIASSYFWPAYNSGIFRDMEWTELKYHVKRFLRDNSIYYKTESTSSLANQCHSCIYDREPGSAIWYSIYLWASFGGRCHGLRGSLEDGGGGGLFSSKSTTFLFPRLFQVISRFLSKEKTSCIFSLFRWDEIFPPLNFIA